MADHSSARAVRQRRYRQRQTRREQVLRIPVNDSLLIALLEVGKLTDEQALERANVERVIAEMLGEWASAFGK